MKAIALVVQVAFYLRWKKRAESVVMSQYTSQLLWMRCAIRWCAPVAISVYAELLARVWSVGLLRLWCDIGWTPSRRPMGAAGISPDFPRKDGEKIKTNLNFLERLCLLLDSKNITFSSNTELQFPTSFGQLFVNSIWARFLLPMRLVCTTSLWMTRW